jgi:WD40 repeat protein
MGRSHLHENRTINSINLPLCSCALPVNLDIWDSATGATRRTLEGRWSHVNAVAFSPDGKLVASASYDKTARLLGLGDGSSAPPLELRHCCGILAGQQARSICS